MRNFERNFLEEFCEKDENHQDHCRILEIKGSFNDKGCTTYSWDVLTIRIDINLGEEFVLVLDQELMHYVLVLNGALLPLRMLEWYSFKVDSLEHMLMTNTHHFLLKKELDLQGFKELQYALSDTVYDMPIDHHHDNEYWLNEQYDKSTFARNFDFESVKEKFEAADVLSVYELFLDSSK